MPKLFANLNQYSGMEVVTATSPKSLALKIQGIVTPITIVSMFYGDGMYCCYYIAIRKV